MPTLTVTTRTPSDLAADTVVIGSMKGAQGVALAEGHGLPAAATSHVLAVLADHDAKGAAGEVHRIVSVPGVKATSVTVTGLGAEASADSLRVAAANALRSLTGKKHVVLALPAADETSFSAVAEGAAGGGYSFTKVGKAATQGAQKITLVSSIGAGKAVKDAAARAEVLGRARDWARDLVNTPPNLLYPASFATAAKDRAKAAAGKVTVTVLDEKALVKGGFGGIVGVGQGSANPPRIVTMTWKPERSKATIAFVGKGITFDSGGLCIKPPAGMASMKSDMAGAAAVAAAVLAVAELNLPVTVTGYLCLAENMPSGTAQRPSDVVTMRNSSTVEILDTDAEGRMVLADGICLATEKKPDMIVDIATLTGAQMVALGNHIAGVMANDDSFRDRVVLAGSSAGEASWPMPLPEVLRKGLDSPTADIAHKADRFGGMLTAGIFLSTFVPEGIRWAHVDIAGPSFNEGSPQGLSPKGGTGYGVATLVALVEQFA